MKKYQHYFDVRGEILSYFLFITDMSVNFFLLIKMSGNEKLLLFKLKGSKCVLFIAGYDIRQYG